jgi:type I restriction enzyme, S subunit
MTVDIASLVSDNLEIWTTAVERKSGAGRGGSGKRVNLYGIGRLRALIFDLAMRGKLVPQDPEDGHASALLHQIALEGVKSAALSKGRARKQFEPSDTIASADELPAGWVWVRLAEIARVIRGVTYGKSDASDCAEVGKISLLRGHNIQSTINFDDLVFVPDSKVSEDQILQKGDIVIAMSSGSSDLVGKGAPFTSDETATFGAFCGVIRPFSESIWPYLSLFCKTPLYRMQTRQGGRGIGIQNLSKGDLEQLQCPLPPLAEQQRIVAQVDELMALCDALEAESAAAMTAHQSLVEALLVTLAASTNAADLATNWARLEAHFNTLFTTEASIDALKKSILDLAVRGKLVEQDAGDEPAFEALKSLAKVKAELIASGHLKQPKVTSALNHMDHPYAIPAGWTAVRFGEAVDVRDGTHDSPKDAVGPDTFPLVTSKDFRDGKIDFSTSRRISANDHYAISQRSLVERNDILFSMIGGNIGNQVMVDSDLEFSIKNVALFKYFSREITLPRYVKIYTENLADRLQSEASGGAQPFVSLGYFRSLFFPLPPTAEQHRIVAKVDELMALCDEIEVSFAAAATMQRQLADTIVERAA